ncbi:MAG: cysteine--tRNA ligase [Deltaproteobacteria bacterium]
MGLRIYNTLTRKKEDFEPIEPGKVKMYVCGVTVYDMCHIGHARSIVLFDVIYRYLMNRGYEVTYVRNFTDVDDKIINRANELGEDWKSLAERFIQEFYRDMDALGVKRPTVEPKATEHIAQIQALIGNLISAGHAYETDGDVMFSVDSFKGYGKLSGKRIEELRAGARIGIDEKKKNPLDFALWKSAKPGEPYWDSPWGEGRPGWHIECSAMSMHYLGTGFDIHGGGADLTFPHHENEIAQSEAGSGTQFVKYWIHNGFVNIRAEKMSKSLGNVLNIRDILEKIHPEALRLFLLSSHYRSPLDYNENSIREASTGLERLYGAMAALRTLMEAEGTSERLPGELVGIEDRFTSAMDDDFNTPRGLAVLFEAARAINRISSATGPRRADIPSRALLSNVDREISSAAANILGLLTEDPADFVDKRRTAGVTDLGVTGEEVEAMIAERARARQEKNYQRADEIRSQLEAKGILLEDSPQGTTWKVKNE